MTGQLLSGRVALTTRGGGEYSVRAVVGGRERGSRAAALTLSQGYADIPLKEAAGYYVQHAWPGDLDGDGVTDLLRLGAMTSPGIGLAIASCKA